jgi:hypothetical protein
MLRSVGGIVDVPQRELRLMPERQARVGRAHARGSALQQPRRKLALETADLLAQCRCHHAKFSSGAAHAAVFNDTYEVAKLT